MSLQLSAALIIFIITIATSLIGLFGNTKLIDRSLFRPYWFLRRRQYDTIVLSGFMHADLMHLIFNMMTFYFFGFLLERAIGSTHFLLLYFAGLLVSHVGTYIKQKNNPEYACLGASGAISGVMGAYLVLHPHRRVRVIMFRMLTDVPGYVAVGLWFLFQLISAFGMIGLGPQAGGGVAFMAHIGGFIAGVVLVKLFAVGSQPPMRRRSAW